MLSFSVRRITVLKRRLIVTWIITLSTAWSVPTSASKKLSPKAQSLATALAQLQNAPDDPRVQQRYLATFPNSYKDFLELFDFNHELYDGHEYIDVLPGLAKNNQMAVGKLLVELSKDAHYEADAPGYLQHATAAYAADYTQHFLGLLKQLPTAKQSNLITFLADVENHHSYPEYQLIIDHARSLGDSSIADRFELARTERSKQLH
jgi:hypothetical protein